MTTSPEIKSLIERGAIFFVSHSGGKDSQAMYLYLKSIVPAEQIVVMHAHLEGVEWDGVIDHIKATIEHELIVCRSQKTFYDMVRHRQMFPSPVYRQCTSDLKTAPMNKVVRNWTKKNGKLLVVNCMGIRAQESANRAKKTPFKFNAGLSKAVREVYDWFPIFKWSKEDVFGTIRKAGQKPHWAYLSGMTRLSCCFCIMASKHDLRISAKLNPEKFQEVVALEKETGHTIFMERGEKIGLADYIASKVEDANEELEECSA